MKVDSAASNHANHKSVQHEITDAHKKVTSSSKPAEPAAVVQLSSAHKRVQAELQDKGADPKVKAQEHTRVQKEIESEGKKTAKSADVAA